MLNTSRLIIQNKFNLSIKTFARLVSKKFDKVIPNLGKNSPKEPIIPYFSEIKKGPPKGESFTHPIMPTKTITNAMNLSLVRPPLSSYYTMQVKDITYHVFNAARISLGRMAAQIAFVIQGKSHPLYKPHQVDYRDKVVIVNGKYVLLTGKKIETKVYRHHTRYPSGLKSISVKHYLEKNCSEMILRTIKGMLPKNKLRKDYLTKVHVFEEAAHNLHHLGLPQFNVCENVDYNKLLQHPEMYPENYEIIATNLEDDSKIDEHIKKKFSVNINEEIYKPPHIRDEAELKVNRNAEQYIIKYIRKHRRKWNRRLRNMGYRYL